MAYRNSKHNWPSSNPRFRSRNVLLKRFHCDPHPGNFAFRQDGSVIIYDYGSVKTLSNEIVYSFKRLVNAARHEDIDLIETELLELHSLAEKVIPERAL